MDVTETEVETSTLDFQVLRAGDGDRDALLFHGFPDDAYSMVPLMERLVDRGFTCTAPYMRGYAPTETPSPSPDNYKVTDLASDVLALRDAVDADEPLYVGHDWGAVAVTAVARLDPTAGDFVVMSVPPDFPEALDEHPSQALRSWYMAAFQIPGVSEEMLRRDDFALIERLWRMWSPNLDAGERVEGVKRTFDRGRTLEASLAYYRSFFEEVVAAGDSIRLRGIQAPTLVLAGRSDGCIQPSMYDESHRCFDGDHRVETLSGGHFLPVESPDAVVEAIEEFHLS